MKVLYVLFLLDTLNLAVYIPIFSAYVRSLGGTPFTIGLINSSSAFITLLWTPIAGSLSDQVGRKGLLVKCMLASSIGSLILCASSSSLILVFIARLIGALGSPVAVLLRSSVADIFKTDEEKKLFLNKSAPLISLGFLVGSLSSGFLSEAKNGYLLSFLLMAVIMGLASFLTQKELPQVVVKSKTNVKNRTSIAKRATQELKSAIINIKTISWPRYKDLFYMRGFADLSMATVFSNVGLIFLQEFNIQGRALGYVFLIVGLCRIVSTVLQLRFKNALSGVLGHRKIFYGGIVQFITCLGMPLSTSISSFIIFLGIFCITRPLMDTTFNQIIAIETQESDRGKVIAAFDNLFPFSMFVAPVTSGLIAEIAGQRILLGLAAIPVSISIWIAYKQRYKTE